MKIVHRLLNDTLLLSPTCKAEKSATDYRWSMSDFASVGISKRLVQDHHSRSDANVLRGLHYQIHHAQGKLIRVLSGRIFDVAVDLRKSSPTYAEHVSIELSAVDNYLLWIPAGYAHGFMVLDGPTEVAYSVTDYRYPEYERTLLWSDPRFAINLSETESAVTLSDKDQHGVLLAQCETYL
jgi:dTDP-4-dehydrorhamnose 3,5-epimerase